MPAQDSFGRRAGRTLTRLFIFVVVLALIGAVVVLLSQLNARTFVLEREGTQIIVRRGRLLPFGTLPYTPSDPRLADAYAPLPAAGATPNHLLSRKFHERDELDRALFDVLAMRAGPLIQTDDREGQTQALAYLRRAQLLTGITSEQTRMLEKLLADAAYFQARLKLDDARRLIAEAVTQLRLAADSDNPQAKSAHKMLSEIGPSARVLEESLRRAVFTLGEAAPTDAPPAGSRPTTPEGTEPVAPQGEEPTTPPTGTAPLAADAGQE